MSNLPLESEVLKRLKETDFQPLEFLDYQESITKLRKILKVISENIAPNSRLDNLDFARKTVFLALKAQLTALEYLNDQHINCQVPWDKRTGLPSHPSMIADIGKYPKFFQCSADLKSVLNSFLGWSLFAKEELLCCCGGSLLKPRKVSFEVMLNHTLRVERIGGDYYLVVKQLVGVKCGDRGHLKNHYNFGMMSQVSDDLSMIFIAGAGFNLKSNKEVNLEFTLSQKADQFNLEEFSRRIDAAISDV